MPPLKRRKVSAAGTAVGTLLSDRAAEIALADRAKAQADAEAAKRTNEATQQANTLINDFKSKNITYEEFVTGLNNLKNSIDNQTFKANIDSALRIGAGLDEQYRIDQKASEYNAGTLSFKDFKSFVDGFKTSNQATKDALGKNLSAARTAENGRAMNAAYQDYLNGKIDIKAYQNQLAALRQEPGQTPEDMAKITTAIDTARKAETQMNDQKAFSSWQQGGSAAEALAYFNARLATSKDPADVQNLTAFIENIKKSADQSAKGSADAYAKLIDENSQKDMEAYKKDILTPAVTACDGDAVCITKAYDGYGERAAQWAKQGGNQAVFWQGESDKAGKAGLIAASNALYGKLDADFTKEMAAAQADKTTTPESQAAQMAAAAAKLIAGETSSFLNDKQKADLLSRRTEAARQIQQLVTAAMAEKNKANEVTTAGVTRLYDDLVKAIPDGITSSNAMAAAGIPITKDANGKTTIDKAAFAAWLQKNMAANAQTAFDLGNAKKNGADSDAAAKAAVEAMIANADTAGRDQTAILTSLYATQFPSLSTAELRAVAKDSNASGKIVLNSNDLNGVTSRLASDTRENSIFAKTYNMPTQIGGLSTSIDPSGNTVISQFGPGGTSLDLGNMSADKGYSGGMSTDALGRQIDAEGNVIGPNGGTGVARGNPLERQSPDAITRNGGDNIRQPTPNDYDYSGPTPVLKNPSMFGPQVDTTTAGPVQRPTSEVPQFDMGLQQQPKSQVSATMDTPTFDMAQFNMGNFGSSNGPSITSGLDVPQWNFQSIADQNPGGGPGASLNDAGNGSVLSE